MSIKPIRVRFAPSPTGPLHMGGVRTALYNYLFAKKNGGKFILRIEDTDQTRFVEGAEEYIIKSLAWCGLEFDESTEKGGEYGPYKQSERKPIYKQYADQLLESGNAYYAFDTSEELERKREEYTSKNLNFQYDGSTRMEMRNSVSLSKAIVDSYLNDNLPYVIRFKMPENETVIIDDAIRGKVTFNTTQLDDKVLFKSDGMPTYHLANVVDDYLMKISHVIRGEEWLPSAPLHVLLYQKLGWNNHIPQFAHLPLILKPTGNGKLSKRDGDKLGFPVFPLEWKSNEGELSKGYREEGYFASAFVNMLALLGWNPGTDQEIFSLEELVGLFSLERVGKSGSKFDPEKTKWFNQQYLRLMNHTLLSKEYLQLVEKKGFTCSYEKAEKIVSLVKERAVFINDLWEQSCFVFTKPTSYDLKVVEKRWTKEVAENLVLLANQLNQLTDFTSLSTENLTKTFIAENNLNMGQMMQCLRLCIVGSVTGPHLFDILDLIGKQETIDRINTAVKEL